VRLANLASKNIINNAMVCVLKVHFNRNLMSALNALQTVLIVVVSVIVLNVKDYLLIMVAV